MPNWYTTRESVKRAIRSNGNENDEAIDRLIEAASRDVDNMTHRWFIPKTQTRTLAGCRLGVGHDIADHGSRLQPYHGVIERLLP